MKHLLYLLSCILFILPNAHANPGDTTWVQAHNDKWLDYYNDFDTAVTFPDGALSYRRIYMNFTLGKYVCPGSPQYCGDWDYTVQTYLMTPGGDTMELGRLITPYANSSYVSTPAGWKFKYVYDVTDFYPLLKNGATIRIHYSGYSGGFTANVKFAFIEGQRERAVTGITRVWNGSFGFGNASDPIDNHMPAITDNVPAGTASSALMYTITGHGSDNNGCGEFCKKHYQVLHNGTLTEQTDIWRANCGRNQVYPQSGTWVYDRANWCPGAKVYSNIHQLPGVTAGASHTVDVNIESYTDNGGASYTMDGAIFYYGAWNKTVDASLDDIISPTTDENHYQENNSCARPQIMVKNTGVATISSLKIQYGLQGGGSNTYTWNGTLQTGVSAQVELPQLAELVNATGTNTFFADIQEVNGAADADATNDAMSATITAPSVWSSQIIVTIKPNNDVNTATGYSEDSWAIYDGDNNMVAQHINLQPNTIYKDTLTLAGNCYRLVVSDDGCDGLNFWANSAGGTGYVQVRPLSTVVPYQMPKYRSADFGCGFTQYFSVAGFTAGISQQYTGEGNILAYPNPAQNLLQVDLEGFAAVAGNLTLSDIAGRTVLSKATNTAHATLDVSGTAPGVYMLSFAGKNAPRVTTRVVISR